MAAFNSGYISKDRGTTNTLLPFWQSSRSQQRKENEYAIFKERFFQVNKCSTLMLHPHTSLAHSWIIPIAGKMTSSCLLTNRDASIGTAPAARMAWIFFGLLLQLHNALQAFWVRRKSFSSWEEILLCLLLSGWIIFTWKEINNNLVNFKYKLLCFNKCLLKRRRNRNC